MGQGDLLPSGGHRRRYDPAYVKKILEGGKKADEIRRKALEHHKKEEEPLAEEELMKELKKLNN
jgi:hypothetical protein